MQYCPVITSQDKCLLFSAPYPKKRPTCVTADSWLNALYWYAAAVQMLCSVISTYKMRFGTVTTLSTEPTFTFTLS